MFYLMNHSHNFIISNNFKNDKKKLMQLGEYCN